MTHTSHAAGGFETIGAPGEPIAVIVRAAMKPGSTEFLTDPRESLQLGFVVYPAGGEIARHIHRPIRRHVDGTSEVVFVKEGRCEVDFYGEDKQLVATREMTTGDVMLLLRGGHGFRMLEDTVLFEVKQGPYGGLDEKETF